MLGGLWALLGRLEVVLGEVDVADDVVVDDGVFARPVEPRLLLGVVGPVFKPLELVAEV